MHSRRRLRELRDFLAALGIPEEDQILRPLARRGKSRQGAVLERDDLVPELTVDVDGVYWHPVGPGDDLLVSRDVFPLRAAMERAEQIWHQMGGLPRARVFQ